MAYVGIDVHKKQSQICTFTEASEILHQHLHTHWGRFVAFLPSAKACILIEASTESAWVARSDRGRPALTYLPDTPVAARAPGLVVDRRIGNVHGLVAPPPREHPPSGPHRRPRLAHGQAGRHDLC